MKTPEEMANEVIDPYATVLPGKNSMSPEIVGVLKTHIASVIRISVRNAVEEAETNARLRSRLRQKGGEDGTSRIDQAPQVHLGGDDSG